jgi:hypothetical protein
MLTTVALEREEGADVVERLRCFGGDDCLVWASPLRDTALVQNVLAGSPDP